ncbi:MAG: hypothetical protein A2Y17_04090 [Clostridiales bacterium GWF2_38_85]|nr:MAG: hypothetical protein A2Y17_04090 [Clostridiales bacterium GWF2_38_85]HBL83466.1 hypothetical protein [Clostridiales bacterium]
MLRISPIFEINSKRRLCELCCTVSDDNALTYSINEDEKEIGVCQFKLTADGGEILVLRNKEDYDDEDSLIIAGRAVLNFIEKNATKKAIYLDKATPNTAKRLGFIDGKLNLEGYFDNCCGSCKH